MEVMSPPKSLNNNDHKFTELKEKVKDFPIQSGVYLMKNRSEKIIYVGKAKNLRNRVRSYFTESKDLSTKTKYLVQNIFSIEFILTHTEVEAFLLEASLIKKHRPRYNIRLRDDKSYPYIKMSMGDTFPRLYLSRKVKQDESIYFGPYTSGAAVFGTIRFLNRVFKIRDCTDAVMKLRTRPCLSYQIGRCSAPCVSLIDSSRYRNEIENARLFLKGQNEKVLTKLTQQMLFAADQEQFEVAAKHRDAIKDIQAVLERQAVVSANASNDQDVIVYYGDERGCAVGTLHIRAGRVIGHRHHFLPQIDPTSLEEDPREWLVDYMNQYYADNFIPDEVLLNTDLGLEIFKLVESVLKERTGRSILVRYAGQGQSSDLDLILMALKNAEVHFQKHVSKSEEKRNGLLEIQEKFSLPKIPQRIECYDISTFQGKENVASQVVFIDGVSSREDYRRYKIKTVIGTDDFASMYEVLKRRFSNKDLIFPDLLLIDGGKGQLSQAIRVLNELEIHNVPVVSLAKARTDSDFESKEVQRTEERFFIPGQQNYIKFRSQSEAFRILVSIRDEAHRFAISYHRKLRESTAMASELDSILGLGDKRKKVLLTEFTSVDQIRSLTAEEICQRCGFDLSLAERLLLQLNSN